MRFWCFVRVIRPNIMSTIMMWRTGAKHCWKPQLNCIISCQSKPKMIRIVNKVSWCYIFIWREQFRNIEICLLRPPCGVDSYTGVLHKTQLRKCKKVSKSWNLPFAYRAIWISTPTAQVRQKYWRYFDCSLLVACQLFSRYWHELGTPSIRSHTKSQVWREYKCTCKIWHKHKFYDLKLKRNWATVTGTRPPTTTTASMHRFCFIRSVRSLCIRCMWNTSINYM